MNDSCLISIIIPVYNVENYLRECLESVLSQDFNDYEIILVDDGSTDNSGIICDDYSKIHSNITVEHKMNGGLSDARNAGLLLAKGKYVLFVDSDDYIGKSSLREISNCVSKTAETIDIVFLEAKKVFEDGKCISLADGYIANEINNRDKATVMQHLALLPKYPGSACTKLIRRELIINNKLFFEKGLLSEDIDWTLGVLLNAKKFAYCNADYYFYRQNRYGSITNTANMKNVECLIYIIKKWCSKTLDKEYQREINSFMSYEYMIALFNYGKLNRNQKKELYSEFQELMWLLEYAQSKKTKIVKYFMKFFGIQLTAFILSRRS